jgi:Superinfection immunity protein
MFLWLYLISAIVAYFIPSYVAYERKNPHLLAIVLVNILLGWTIVGWIAALVMALVDPRLVSNLGVRIQDLYYTIIASTPEADPNGEEPVRRP